jgi:hypothetical protein
MKRFLGLIAVIALHGCGRGEDPDRRPGASGAGGSAAGSSSTGGTSGAGLNAVASVLDGYVMKQPCLSQSGPRACRTHAPGACPVSQDPAFAGSTPTRETLSFGGQTGTLYDVTLHVQGIVEPKVYRGGNDASDLATNGFLTAGTVDNVRNQHSAYALRVTVPTGTYFFNSLGRENVRHSAFPVDYEATITVQGATPIEVWVSDPNCQALKNCGDPDVPTECTPVDLPDLEPKIRESLGVDAREYDGQFLGFVVKSVVQRN